MMSRRRWTGSVLFGVLTGAAVPWALAAQTGAGTISGRVVDVDGSPMRDALVEVHEAAARGSLSDSEGRFVVEAVPAGFHVLRARLLGYQPGFAFVDLGASDSASATIVLAEARVPISGTNPPLPDADHRQVATALLPALFDDVTVITFLTERRPPPDGNQPIVAWAPWKVPSDTVVIGRADDITLVVGTCAECALAWHSSIEGGRYYTVGQSHVAVALEPNVMDRRIVTFRLGFAEAGTVVMLNSPGSGPGLDVTMARRGDGDWMVVRFDGS